MAQLNFNASTVAPSTGISEPIPAGWYQAIIDESEMKPTKDGMGQYLQLRFNVIEGQFAGRKVFSRLNLVNRNQTAVDIAYGDLSAIAHAVNVIQVQDSGQLHAIPMMVRVKVRPASGDYEASNEITTYRSLADHAQQMQTAGQGVAGGAPGQAGGFANAGFPTETAPQQQAQQAPIQQTAQPWQETAPAQAQNTAQQAQAQPQATTWQEQTVSAPTQAQQAPQQQTQQVAQQAQTFEQPVAQPWQETAQAQQTAPVENTAQPQGQAVAQPTGAPAGGGTPPWQQ